MRIPNANSGSPGPEGHPSSRRDGFVRLKENKEAGIDEQAHAKKIEVVFNPNIGDITRADVKLVRNGGPAGEIRNVYVFIFAGGERPTELLKKAGVQMRTEEVAAGDIRKN